jgi:hypothetical protein
MWLYKLAQSGKTVKWRAFARGNTVYTEYGEDGGKLQTSSYIAEPKNIGKSNATTAEEQAVIEVEQAYYDKRKNKSYTDK